MSIKIIIVITCFIFINFNAYAQDAVVDQNTFLLEKPNDSSFSLKLKDGYFAKLKDINLQKGEIKYKLFVQGSEEPVGYYSYINNTLKNAVTIQKNDIEQAVSSYQSDTTDTSNSSATEEVLKEENELDLSQFLVSIFLLDSDKIDIAQTLTRNKVILVSPYKRAFDELSLDEKSLLFYIKFFVKCDQWLLNLNSYVLFIFIPYVLVAFLFNKTINKDKEGAIEGIVLAVVILYFFYLVPASDQVSRTLFQNLYTTYIQKTLELSTSLTNIFSSTFTSYQARNSGKLDKQELENIITDSLQNRASLPYYKEYFNTCLSNYNTNLFTIRDDEGFIFPKNLAINNLGSSWSERSTQNDTSVISLTSLEFCHNAEAKIKAITVKQVENTKILEDYQASLGDKLNQEQLALLQKMQAQNVHDFGFISTPLIASNNMFSENLNMFQRTQKSQNDIETAITKKDKDDGLQKGVIADSTLGNMIELLPYMLVPGADSVKKTVTDTIGTVSSKFEALPFVGTFVSATKEAVGAGVTIFLIKYIILYLPIILLIVAAFLNIIYYFISIIVYLNLSPFVATWALAKGQNDQLKTFFVKGIFIGLKPLILVISIVLSVIGLDLIKALNLFLIEKQFNNFFAITMTQETLSIAYAFSDDGLLFLKGFIALAISIASGIIVFYIVLNGADVIQRILGIDERTGGDAQTTLGNQVEQKTSRFSKM